MEEEIETISSIIDRMDGKFGTDFDLQDEDLREKAIHNTLDNFTYSFENRFLDVLISRMTDKNFYMKMKSNEGS